MTTESNKIYNRVVESTIHLHQSDPCTYLKKALVVTLLALSAIAIVACLSCLIAQSLGESALLMHGIGVIPLCITLVTSSSLLILGAFLLSRLKNQKIPLKLPSNSEVNQTSLQNVILPSGGIPKPSTQTNSQPKENMEPDDKTPASQNQPQPTQSRPAIPPNRTQNDILIAETPPLMAPEKKSDVINSPPPPEQQQTLRQPPTTSLAEEAKPGEKQTLPHTQPPILTVETPPLTAPEKKPDVINSPPPPEQQQTLPQPPTTSLAEEAKPREKQTPPHTQPPILTAKTPPLMTPEKKPEVINSPPPPEKQQTVQQPPITSLAEKAKPIESKPLNQATPITEKSAATAATHQSAHTQKPQKTDLGTSKISQPSAPQKELRETFVSINNTATRATIQVTLKEGKTVRETMNALLEKYGDCVLYFGGRALISKEILASPLGDKDAYRWATEDNRLASGTCLQLILKKGRGIKNELPREEKQLVLASFNCLIREGGRRHAMISLPKTATLQDCCDELAIVQNRSPVTTYVRVIVSGKLLSKPELLIQNIFALQEEYKFSHLICLHALYNTLSPEECKEFCQLFEQYKFPQFPKNHEPEKTIEIIRHALIWGACNRVLRKRPGAGSSELEQQRQVLSEILKHPTISRNVSGFVMGLADLVNAAYNQYVSSAMSSYDALRALLEGQRISLPPLPAQTPNEETVELQIGESKYTIEKAKLLTLSKYLESHITGGFKESQEQIDVVELEGQSIHLFEYFDKGKDFNLSNLSYEELGALLDTAESLIFAELSCMCQEELIQRIKNCHTVTDEMRIIYKKAPIIHNALRIRLSQDLWKSPDFKKKIQTIKDKLGAQPAPPTSVTLKEDRPITLILPSGRERKLLQSQLMKCGFFHSLFSHEWKDSKEQEFTLDVEIPDSLLDYLRSGSDGYKHNMQWSEIKEIIQLAAFLDLPELTYHFKLKVCDKLLEAHENGWEKNFCDICASLRKEIEQWA